MTGYQEVLTDPSYAGQIVTMTCAEIGNYGVSPDDVESRKPQVAGFIIRDESPVASNWRAEATLRDYLVANRIVAISDIDTRALTRLLRSGGVMRGVIATGDGARRRARWSSARNAIPKMEGSDLVRQVTSDRAFDWPDEDPDEFGIVPERRAEAAAEDRRLRLRDEVEHHAPPERARLRRTRLSRRRRRRPSCWRSSPDGVFLSNGPGDPAPLTYAIENAKALVDADVPVFGICLGHQILGLAMGGRTFKLKFGHRGANHPVKKLETGKIEITSQNHGFAVDPASLPADVEVTHQNLYDGTVEGLRHRTHPVFCVQYHPEASPGPHDADYLFDDFIKLIEEKRG